MKNTNFGIWEKLALQKNLCYFGWMDGCMNGWMNQWMDDGWMDVRMDG